MAATGDASPEGTNPATERPGTAPAPAQGVVAGRKGVPWRGRKRADGDAKEKFIAVRVTERDRDRIEKAAREAGLKIGGYLRALALGSAGPRAVKRPRVEREQLARILGEIGKIGSNVNQLAKWSNRDKSAASAAELAEMRAYIAVMRDHVMKALDRGD
jgi:hypothetical protein